MHCRSDGKSRVGLIANDNIPSKHRAAISTIYCITKSRTHTSITMSRIARIPTITTNPNGIINKRLAPWSIIPSSHSTECPEFIGFVMYEIGARLYPLMRWTCWICTNTPNIVIEGIPAIRTITWKAKPIGIADIDHTLDTFSCEIDRTNTSFNISRKVNSLHQCDKHRCQCKCKYGEHGHHFQERCSGIILLVEFHWKKRKGIEDCLLWSWRVVYRGVYYSHHRTWWYRDSYHLSWCLYQHWRDNTKL